MEGSRYFRSPYLYKENGFKEKQYAEKLIGELSQNSPLVCQVEKNREEKKKNKNPPLLFNLAELQNVCSRLFKISPDETLRIVQELYEKKLVTIPEQMPGCFPLRLQKKFTKTFSGLTQISSDRRGGR